MADLSSSECVNNVDKEGKLELGVNEVSDAVGSGSCEAAEESVGVAIWLAGA